MNQVVTSFKTKMLLLSIIPLIVVTVAITMISLKQAHHLSEQEIQTFEENLLRSKRQELKHYVSLAMSSISHILTNTEVGDKAAEAEIKRVLSNMTYGDDGYFFLYDANGVALSHPIQPELVGQNLYTLQDRNGQFVIQELLQLAEQGGGYFRYLWRKPSKGDLEDKLSYVVQIPEYNWMMGTGLYIDDIAKEVTATRKKVTQNIRRTFFTVVGILAGSVILITLLGLGINVHASQLANKRLRELAHRSVQFQVSQRRNVARELHDGINQLVVSIKFRVELARNKLLKNDDSALDDLNKGLDVLDQVIQEVRRISHDLRPILLDDLGLESALQSLANEFSERTAIKTKLNVQLPPDPLPEDIEITLYRISQEALINVDRHAKASEVNLAVWQQDGFIWVEIEDDGCGFVAHDRDNKGIGLLNMRERSELLSGRFSIRSKPGSGTSVKAGFALV